MGVLGIGIGINKGNSINWNSYLFGQNDLNFWVKSGTRNGLTLPDTIDPGTGDVKILTPINKTDGSTDYLPTAINNAVNTVWVIRGKIVTNASSYYFGNAVFGLGTRILDSTSRWYLLWGNQVARSTAVNDNDWHVFIIYDQRLWVLAENYALDDTSILYAINSLTPTATTPAATMTSFANISFGRGTASIYLATELSESFLGTITAGVITWDARYRFVGLNYYLLREEGVYATEYWRGTLATKSYSLYGSTHCLDKGYTIYQQYQAEEIDIIVANKTDGTVDANKAISSIYLIKTIDGDLTDHNLMDSKLRFSQAFFDRSNATIWNDNARSVNFASIPLTGTSGTADVNINGTIKTLTFATNLNTTKINFIDANEATYEAIGVKIKSIVYNFGLYFCSLEGTSIATATITNTSGNLTGTVTTSGYYDAANPKDWHISELNQRTIYGRLNAGYRGMFYVYMDSGSINLHNAIIDEYRKTLWGFMKYATDNIGIDNRKVLTYTGDIAAGVKSGGIYQYDTDGYLKIGILKSTKPMLTVRLDDEYDDIYNNWKGVLDSYGIKGSLPILTDDVGTGGYMTYAQLIELKNAGWELIGHGIGNGEAWAGQTNAYVDAKLLSIKTILAVNGVNINYINTHETNGNNLAARELSKQYYTGYSPSQDIAENGQPLNPLAVDAFNIHWMLCDVIAGTYNTSTDEGKAAVKAQIDICWAQNRWGIIIYHTHTSAKETEMREILDYAITKGFTSINFVTQEEAVNSCEFV